MARSTALLARVRGPPARTRLRLDQHGPHRDPGRARRNTLYHYASDRTALVLALTRRVGQPTVDRVAAIAARSTDPGAERMREILETVLAAIRPATPPRSTPPGISSSSLSTEVDRLHARVAALLVDLAKQRGFRGVPRYGLRVATRRPYRRQARVGVYQLPRTRRPATLVRLNGPLLYHTRAV